MADKFRTALDWENVRFFVTLARHGSLSATARFLGVNHATVSRRVASLEASVGAALFDRRPSGYALTETGEAMLESAALMEDAAQGLHAGASISKSPSTVAGLVRISATPSIAEALLIDDLALLRREHPALDIELIADRRVVSLSRHEADLALRLGRPSDSTLIGQRLATLSFGLYATREIAEAFAGGKREFISFDDTGTGLPEALWLRETFPETRLVFRANSQMAQAAAARAGFGVAVLPHFLTAGDPGLMRVPFVEQPPQRELWLLTRRGSDRIERFKVVKTFLVERFRSARQRFAGA